MDLVEVWPNLAGFASREKRRPVGSVGLDFSCENPPTNLPVSVPGHGNPSPTVVSVR